MIRYVVVSDLIINGGEGCTILKEKPYADYITIEIEDSTTSHIRCVLITHNNNECLFFRETREDMFIDPEKDIVDDLNNACMELFRYKLCRGCKHFMQDHDWKTVPCDRCCGYERDNWNNFKRENYPEKSDDYEADKVSITNETGIIFTNVGKEICHSLPNEPFNNFLFRLGWGWLYKYE